MHDFVVAAAIIARLFMMYAVEFHLWWTGSSLSSRNSIKCQTMALTNWLFYLDLRMARARCVCVTSVFISHCSRTVFSRLYPAGYTDFLHAKCPAGYTKVWGGLKEFNVCNSLALKCICMQLFDYILIYWNTACVSELWDAGQRWRQRTRWITDVFRSIGISNDILCWFIVRALQSHEHASGNVNYKCRNKTKFL